MHVRRGHAVCISLCTMETMQYMHNQKYAVRNVKCAGYAICTMCRAQGACRVISWLSRGRRCHTNHNAHSAQKFGSRNVRFLYFYSNFVLISMILRDQDIKNGCRIIYASSKIRSLVRMENSHVTLLSKVSIIITITIDMNTDMSSPSSLI